MFWYILLTPVTVVCTGDLWCLLGVWGTWKLKRIECVVYSQYFSHHHYLPITAVGFCRLVIFLTSHVIKQDETMLSFALLSVESIIYWEDSAFANGLSRSLCRSRILSPFLFSPFLPSPSIFPSLSSLKWPSQ